MPHHKVVANRLNEEDVDEISKKYFWKGHRSTASRSFSLRKASVFLICRGYLHLDSLRLVIWRLVAVALMSLTAASLKAMWQVQNLAIELRFRFSRRAERIRRKIRNIYFVSSINA